MTVPICSCRVIYLGSVVPTVTKDGLKAVQGPLRDLYPENSASIPDSGSAGIDSWVSVWSNGILIENVDEAGRKLRRFYPIESLHYCAAVRYVRMPTNSAAAGPDGDGDRVAKFLPLDSPFLRRSPSKHPPLFACILRRTSGIKVLECHAFICRREPAANALVRCCFHAFADNVHAKQLEEPAYEQIKGVGQRSRSVSALDKRPSSSEDERPPSNESINERMGTTGNRNSSTTSSPDTIIEHQPPPSKVAPGREREGARSRANSQSPADDDDNYKVWNRSLEAEKPRMSRSSSLRTPKLRQMVNALPVPPPPLPPIESMHPNPAIQTLSKEQLMMMKKQKRKQQKYQQQLQPNGKMNGGQPSMVFPFQAPFVAGSPYHHPVGFPPSNYLNQIYQYPPALVPSNYIMQSNNKMAQEKTKHSTPRSQTPQMVKTSKKSNKKKN